MAVDFGSTFCNQSPQFESEQLTASELSSVAATLSSLKIDYEQVKKDIADNVHNYSVATFHLLRLQKIRERTPIKVSVTQCSGR